MKDNTTKNRFRHLTLVERGKISAYLDQGLKVTEIAQKLGCHRSTVYREIKRGTVNVIKQVHGYERDVAEYAPFAAQAVYDKGRAKAKHRNLIESNKISSDFLNALIKEMKKKLRKFSVETFIHHYKAMYTDVYVPCFKTIYRYIHQQLISLKPIEMPRMVRYKARKVAGSTCPHKKKLGNSIDFVAFDLTIGSYIFFYNIVSYCLKNKYILYRIKMEVLYYKNNNLEIYHEKNDFKTIVSSSKKS